MRPQVTKRVLAPCVSKIDVARPFSTAGVDDQGFYRRQMRCGHQQHVSAMRRQRAPGYRAGDYPGQIEHPYSFQWPRPPWTRLGWSIPNTIDAKQGFRRYRRTLGVLIPLTLASQHRRDGATLRRHLFKVLGGPTSKRRGDRLSIVVALQNGKNAVAMMREVGMNPHPPAVAASIGTSNRIPQ